jgi:hypothetical protein
MYVTTVSYKDPRSDSIHLSPIREIQKIVTAGPRAITNRSAKSSLTNGSATVAGMYVCVCVHLAALNVTGLGFMYVYVCI